MQSYVKLDPFAKVKAATGSSTFRITFTIFFCSFISILNNN